MRGKIDADHVFSLFVITSDTPVLLFPVQPIPPPHSHSLVVTNNNQAPIDVIRCQSRGLTTSFVHWGILDLVSK